MQSNGNMVLIFTVCKILQWFIDLLDFTFASLTMIYYYGIIIAEKGYLDILLAGEELTWYYKSLGLSFIFDIEVVYNNDTFDNEGLCSITWNIC